MMMGPPQERAPHRNCSSSCAMVGAMSLRAAAAGSHGAAADPNILNQRRSSGSRIHGAPRCLPINGGPLRAQAAGRPEGRNAASSFKNVFQPVTERKWAPSGCQIEQKLGAFAVGPLPGRRQAGTAASALSNLEAVGVSEDSEQELLYSYVVFDMDGTLTVSNIDFKLMRERTGIMEGDLFTVMDSWGDAERVTAAHDIILEMEATACQSLELQPGLTPLLALLRERNAAVALVTRNTTLSVNSFFQCLGEEWRSLFSIILTREFRYVKPDKRLLLWVADQWGVDPASLLMVGDSREDVECGKAAGTGTCLISGGGNELSAKPTPGAEPTFKVSSLKELQDILSRRSQTPSLPTSPSLPAALAGPPSDVAVAAALRLVDGLLAGGAIRAAFCSYPRLAGAFGGETASTREGDRVLHLNCGDGSLTKLLASQGMTVAGVDEDATAVEAAASRGLVVHQASGEDPLLRGGQKPVDVVLAFSITQLAPDGAVPGTALASRPAAASTLQGPFWASASYADRIWKALVLGGRFAAGHLIYDPPASMTLADAGVSMELASRHFVDRGFIVSRQAVERSADGILASLVVNKPGMAAFGAR